MCCCVQAGRKLVAVNLSNQSDASDLLGGYKPVQAGTALMPLVHQLDMLMRDTWPQGKNDAFLSQVHRLAKAGKWPRLVQAFEAPLAKVRCTTLVARCVAVPSLTR